LAPRDVAGRQNKCNFDLHLSRVYALYSRVRTSLVSGVNRLFGDFLDPCLCFRETACPCPVTAVFQKNREKAGSAEEFPLTLRGERVGKPVSSLRLDFGRMSRRAAMDSRSREVKVVLLGDTGEPCPLSLVYLQGRACSKLGRGRGGDVRRITELSLGNLCRGGLWEVAVCMPCSSCSLVLLLPLRWCLVDERLASCRYVSVHTYGT